MLSLKQFSIIICETADAGLAAKASKSGVSIGTLRKVYRRGVAAWNSGHRPGTTPQQWGMARVNSYITKGKGTYHGADKDLREEEIVENNLPEVPKDKESGLPKKYVAGLSASTAKARAAHFDKMDKKSDSDPSAYAPAPGDAEAKTKESKHTKKYREMFGEEMDEELYEACWDTHKQVGMKKKGDRMVPDCVPKNEEVEPIAELDTKTLKSYVNKNLKSNDTSDKRDTGLYRATNKIAKTQATSTLDKKVKTLGNTSASAHKNPYEYEASRSELKDRGIHNFAGRRTRTEDVEAQFDLIEEVIEDLALQHNLDPEYVWEKFEQFSDEELLEYAVDAK
jgi:hypothetical protein